MSGAKVPPRPPHPLRGVYFFHTFSHYYTVTNMLPPWHDILIIFLSWLYFQIAYVRSAHARHNITIFEKKIMIIVTYICIYYYREIMIVKSIIGAINIQLTKIPWQCDTHTYCHWCYELGTDRVIAIFYSSLRIFLYQYESFYCKLNTNGFAPVWITLFQQKWNGF